MLIGGSRREQVLFAGVMKELLAPINNPRYVIIGKEWGVRAYCVSFPCPSVFARRQQDAEILRRQLDRCLTHCTMYTPALRKAGIRYFAAKRVLSSTAMSNCRTY